VRRCRYETAASRDLGVEARRQFVQRRGGALNARLRLGAVGVEAAVSFRQRRLARGVRIDLALGIGMTFARGVGFGAARRAKASRAEVFRRGCGFQFGVSGFQRLTLGRGIDAARSSSFSISTSRARSARRRAAPVAHWARATNPSQRQTSPPATPALAGLQLRYQSARALWRRRRSGQGDAPARRAASTCAASASPPRAKAGSPPVTPVLVQRIGAYGSTGASRWSPNAAPSAFHSPCDGDAVDDRRPEVLGSPLTSFERCGFGLDRCSALVGLVKRRRGAASSFLARGDMVEFAGLRGQFGLRPNSCCAVSMESVECGKGRLSRWSPAPASALRSRHWRYPDRAVPAGRMGAHPASS